MRPLLKLALLLFSFCFSIYCFAQSPVAQIRADTLDGYDGFIIDGLTVNDWLGTSATGIGDINNDGIDDILLGSINANSKAGEVYILFGSDSTFIAPFELGSLDGINGFKIEGETQDDRLGISASSAGDLNNDNIDDFMIGAYTASPNDSLDAGKTYVIFGSNTSFGSVLDLSLLDGTNGFVINGINAGDKSGSSISGAGDINDDGIDDMIIGASSANETAGEAYVVFGSQTAFTTPFELSSLDGTEGFILVGSNMGDVAGTSVSNAGDFNDDGIDDLIIGASSADPFNRVNAGTAYILYGSSSAFNSTVVLEALNGTDGTKIYGEGTNDRMGNSVSLAGDINGDLIDDVIIGAFVANPNGQADNGQSFVIYGGSGFPSSFDTNNINGTNGFSLNGINNGDRSGVSVDGAGDVNGDQIDDLIIGAYNADPNGQNQAGETYVIYGGNSFSSQFELSTLNGVNGFIINGVDVSDGSGLRATGAGDFNNDGFNDILVAARHADPQGNFDAGECYVVFGGNTQDINYDVRIVNPQFDCILNTVRYDIEVKSTITGTLSMNFRAFLSDAQFSNPLVYASDDITDVTVSVDNGPSADRFDLDGNLLLINGNLGNTIDTPNTWKKVGSLLGTATTPVHDDFCSSVVLNIGLATQDISSSALIIQVDNQDDVDDIYGAEHYNWIDDPNSTMPDGSPGISCVDSGCIPVNYDVRMVNPQFDCVQNTVRFDIEVQSTITGTLSMNFRAFFSDAQFSNPLVYASDDITDVTVSVDNGPSADRFDLDGNLLMINGNLGNTIDTPNSWKKVGSVLATATTPLGDDFCSSAVLNVGLATQDISSSALIIQVDNQDDVDDAYGAEHYNWIDDPNSTMPDGSPDTSCLDSACTPTNFEIRIVNPQFDCSQNTVSYDIEFKSTHIGTADVILRMFFSNDYLNPYVYNSDGITLASNFSAQTVPLSNVFDLSGADVTFINCAVQGFISSADAWENIGSIKAVTSTPLNGDFCGSIILNRDLGIENIISAQIEASIIYSNVSYMDLDGVFGIEHFNWTNNPNNTMPTGSPDSMCLDSACDNTSQAKVNYWSNDGDYYSDNPDHGIILTSPSGVCFRLKVDDDGKPVFEPVTCP